ncbi:MAG TPA: TRAP transporter TatT component family protein [Syntrophobacteraceae bacterium]|nr:TRAP transporter TatT component family protein [Syntrophobacteraceae bacterium]
MPIHSRSFAVIMGTVVLLFVAGCAPVKQLRVATVALTLRDVADAAGKQSSPRVIREGTPAYLMLLDGLLEAEPRSRELLLAACRAYVSYASSLVGQGNPEEVSVLFFRGRDFGFRALSESLQTNFKEASSGTLDGFAAVLAKCGKKDVPALFWTTNAWANWIALNTSKVEALGDLPMLEAAMKRTLELDETYFYGGPHVIRGIYLASKPAVLGGNPAQAKVHFDRARELSGDKNLVLKVYLAEYYARSVGDRELYRRSLEEVLAAPLEEGSDMTLSNVMAKEKARWLLDKTEEYFEPER